jgi:hypothetical protein
MDFSILVPGSFALVGALVGVLLTNYLARRGRRRDDGNSRLDRAIESVAIAISARNFAVHLSFENAPKSLTAEQVTELETKIYLSNLERVFLSLRDARRDIAVLAADGLDVGDAWRSDEDVQRELGVVPMDVVFSVA